MGRVRDLYFFAISALLAATLALGGCSLMGLADNLPHAMAEHTDPETVRAAAPSYLLLSDALVRDDPEDPETLLSAANLYTAYCAVFIDKPGRREALSARALHYASRAFCAERDSSCGLTSMKFDEVEALTPIFDEDDLPYLHALSSSWLLWISANSADWGAMAQLPKAELLIRRALELDETFDSGAGHHFMGILKTLRPSALGGRPEEGRGHFERAIELSNGQNLAVKVELAARYARLVFDRELHDKLLTEVLETETEERGLTLSNILARERARKLLDSADEYF